jgi:hypothetical protein
VFTQIRPVWVGELGTRPKIQKVYGFDLIIAILYFEMLSATALKEFTALTHF